MSIYFKLGLVGLLLTRPEGTAPHVTEEDNPCLCNILKELDVMDDVGKSKEELKKRLFELTAALEGRFTYYQSSKLKVNWPLTQYLGELLQARKEGKWTPAKDISMMICAMGNKPSESTFSEGVLAWLAYARLGTEYLVNIYEGTEAVVPEVFRENLKTMEHAEKVLQLLDVFVTCRLGMLAGVEEYSSYQIQGIEDLTDPDFEMDVKCNNTNGCVCGCELDHDLMLLQGMEDILNGIQSYAANYVVGVASVYSVPINLVTGTEGAILDGIKEIGAKAYTVIVASFNAIKELVTPKDDEEKAEGIVSRGEDNKKALQAMEDKSVQINDKARDGIMKLADQADPSGGMKKAVQGMTTPGAGPNAIDSLLGLLKTEVTAGSALGVSYKAADKALSDLKASSDTVAGKDETNKEVVSASREQITAKIATAKEALELVKAEVTKHNKRMTGIDKAVSGINPKIFTKAEA